MRYLDCYGGIWKVSDRNYKRFLRDAAAGKGWNLDDYGKMIANDPIHVTDLDAETAQDLLDGMLPTGRLAGRIEEDDDAD